MRMRTFFLLLALPCTLAACSKLDDPTAGGADHVVALRVVQDSIEADGVGRASVEVTLDRDTPLGTEVTVTTSAGTLAGAGQSAAGQLKFNAGSRTESLVLISSTHAGVVTVTAQTGKSFASDSIRFTPASPSALELSADRTTATANGQDAITLTAKLFRPLGAGSVSEGTRVRFDVFSSGALQPELSGTVETTADGTATRRLTSRVAGTFQVIASADSRSDTLSAVFNPPSS